MPKIRIPAGSNPILAAGRAPPLIGVVFGLVISLPLWAIIVAGVLTVT